MMLTMTSSLRALSARLAIAVVLSVSTVGMWEASSALGQHLKDVPAANSPGR
jgi:hypothetical protein